jgi:putative phage-type endonuclease
VNAPAPGSPEWLTYMTASKIAAVVGTSPYESRFSLWHRMHGDLGPQEVNAQMGVGHVLEPALLDWWQSQHPEFELYPSRWMAHDSIPWAAATPDGLAATSLGVEALVEVKTARDSWEWRDDQVPEGYRDQCQWQMFVTGTRRVYIAALVSMELIERTVEWDTARIEHLVSEAVAFMASLEAGTPPAIDGSAHTYQAVRELHPDIDPDDVEIPGVLAVAWLDARESLAESIEAEQRHKSEIAALMGTARRAVWDGHTLFTRQSRGGGTPYLVAGRNLPTGAAA